MLSSGEDHIFAGTYSFIYLIFGWKDLQVLIEIYIYPGSHIKTCPDKKVASKPVKSSCYFLCCFALEFLLVDCFFCKGILSIINVFRVCKKPSVLIRENFTRFWDNVCPNIIKFWQNIINNNRTAFAPILVSTKGKKSY